LGLIEVEECVDVNDELKVQQSNDSNTNKKARTARGPRFTLSDCNMAVSSSRSSFVITFSTELM
ncbi:hypothetical protein ACSLNR_29160, partial [Escherichia coli]